MQWEKMELDIKIVKILSWYSFVRSPLFENDPKLVQPFNREEQLNECSYQWASSWIRERSKNPHENIGELIRLKLLRWLLAEKALSILLDFTSGRNT